MSEHFGAVEADFQSYYGLDLREVLWGRVRYGVRRLWALVQGLPPEGAVARVVLYGGRPWSISDELLANIVEVLDHANRMYFGAHTKQGTRVWDPVQIIRPWRGTEADPEASREPRKQATPAEMAQVFGGNIVHDYTPGPREGE